MFVVFILATLLFNASKFISAKMKNKQHIV